MLWAITCYFNPVGYRRRRQNYRRFQRALNVPLLTVELSYQDTFELGNDEADMLIRLRGRDVLWQKERLLNVALEHLPAECDRLAWLDCDVLLDSPAWGSETESLLDRYPLVQLFRDLVHLPPDGGIDDAPVLPASARRTSLAHRWGTRSAPLDLFLNPEGTSQLRCNCGMAWAGRRALLERHGFYDAMVLGMGDKMFAAAAVGRHEDAALAYRLNRAQSDHYRQWAIPFGRDVAGMLGYRDGSAYHLWHGDLSDRNYVKRYDGFEAFDFDPYNDLALDPAGCWRWSTPKTDLHHHVAQYFRRRHEDGRLLPRTFPRRGNAVIPT
jgi:hypothetical protein